MSLSRTTLPPAGSTFLSPRTQLGTAYPSLGGATLAGNINRPTYRTSAELAAAVAAAAASGSASSSSLTSISPPTLTSISPPTLTSIRPSTLTSISPSTLTSIKQPSTLTSISPSTLTSVKQPTLTRLASLRPAGHSAAPLNLLPSSAPIPGYSGAAAAAAGSQPAPSLLAYSRRSQSPPKRLSDLLASPPSQREVEVSSPSSGSGSRSLPRIVPRANPRLNVSPSSKSRSSLLDMPLKGDVNYPSGRSRVSPVRTVNVSSGRSTSPSLASARPSSPSERSLQIRSRSPSPSSVRSSVSPLRSQTVRSPRSLEDEILPRATNRVVVKGDAIQGAVCVSPTRIHVHKEGQRYPEEGSERITYNEQGRLIIPRSSASRESTSSLRSSASRESTSPLRSLRSSSSLSPRTSVDLTGSNAASQILSSSYQPSY